MNRLLLEQHIDPTLEQAAEWLVRLNDPSVTEADFTAWQAWLAESPVHARAFNEIQDTWQRSASVPTAAMGARASEARNARAAREEGARPSSRQQAPSCEQAPKPLARRAITRQAVTRCTGVLAATVLIAAAGIAIWRSSENVITTATAELRSIRLSDGSLVALGPETRLEIAYTKETRALRMATGEAYFEVARQPARPFLIETPAGRVVAVGTAFSVHATQQRVAVSVTHGVVRVEPPPAVRDMSDERDFGSDVRIVTSGQRLVREGAWVEVQPLASSDDAIAWQQRRLEYQGDPLRIVVSDINRYSEVKLRVTDPALNELRYTGTVFPDTLDAWLTSIQGVFPLRVETSGGEHLLIPTEQTDRSNF